MRNPSATSSTAPVRPSSSAGAIISPPIRARAWLVENRHDGPADTFPMSGRFVENGLVMRHPGPEPPASAVAAPAPGADPADLGQLPDVTHWLTVVALFTRELYWDPPGWQPPHFS